MSGHQPAVQPPTPPRASPDLSRLSPREVDIVERLLAGDRVPRIAESLYLAPSTVRNHLSSVFGKFGVNSQQELIVLLRTSTRSA
jgi:DNA-binding CsgD family transcriptional regulator